MFETERLDPIARGRGAPGGGAVGASASALVGSLVDGSSMLAATDWVAVDGPELLASLRGLVRVARRAEAAIAAGAWALEHSRAAEAASGLGAAGWLADVSRGCGGEGAWRVRAGRLMERFAGLGAAVRDGELGTEHLRVLDDVRDPEVLEHLADQDAELLAAASRLDLMRWRREVRARVSAIREALEAQRRAEREAAVDAEEGATDAEDDAEERPEVEGEPEVGEVDGDRGARPEGESSGQVQGDDERVAHDPEGWLSVRPTAGGGLLLRGELFGEPAEVLRQALLAESSRQWRTAWVEHDQFGTALPVAGELRARALAELVRRGLGVDQTSTIGPRTDAVVVITVGDESVAERVRALDGEPLPTEVAAVLTCDAGLQALLVGRAGQPLWLGRSHRLATRAQRRALAIRDGGCVFPGCTMPAEWCDVHHEPGWQRGGRTDLDHMVLLCRRHHGAVHGNRWVLRTAGGPASTTGPPEPPQEMVGVEGEGSGVGPPGGVPPGGGPPGQRFEWHDRHGHRRLPAQQRGTRPAA